MIHNSIIGIIYFIFAGILLFTEPMTGDNLVRFWGCMVFGSVFLVSAEILYAIKKY